MSDAAVLEVDGVRYRVSLDGDPSRPALVLMHGFTGSAASWRHLLQRFNAGWRTVTLDLIGHGGSDAPDDPTRYLAGRQVSDVAGILDRLGIGRCALLGYSMGGRLALAFAAEHPDRVSRLVLESASPGIDDPNDRESRRASDDALATRIERDGAEAFVDEWERLPLFASLADAPEDRRERLRRQRRENRETGLAGSLRGFGQGVQPSLHGALGLLPMPVLLVAGTRDEKYARIAREMALAIPDATVRLIDGAGHMPHLEKPDEFAGAVLAFLEARLAPGATREDYHAGRVAASG